MLVLLLVEETVARYLSRVLGLVPERPINTKTRIRILLHFLYLPSYPLLRVICVRYHYCISE